MLFGVRAGFKAQVLRQMLQPQVREVDTSCVNTHNTVTIAVIPHDKSCQRQETD